MSGGVMALSRAALTAPRRLWTAYTRHLGAAPVKTKVATSVAAAAAGDALAQRLGRARPAAATAHGAAPAAAASAPPPAGYDWPRTLRLVAFNALMGALGHHYYRALDARVCAAAPTSPAGVAAKVAIDQLLFAPLVTAAFYAYKCAAEGRPAAVAAELREKFAPTVRAGWALWVPAHVANFALVPPAQRVLYANAVSVAGTCILSRAAAGDFTRARRAEVVCDGVLVRRADVESGGKRA